MTPELNLIALAVGAALVLLAVHGFRWAQARSSVLSDLSAIADGRVVQLLFLAFVAALALGGRMLGVVLPEYVTAFLPSAVEGVIGGLLASEVWRTARRAP